MYNTTSRLAHTGRGRITFQPSPQRYKALMEGKRWSLILVGRTVVIAPDPNGIFGYAQDNNHCAGDHPWSYEWTGVTTDTPMARFMVGAIDVDHYADCMEFDIPLDHELPWPMLNRGARCLEVVENELRLRLRSCNIAQTDPRDVTNNVPQIARDLIGSAGIWMKIVNEELELT